MSGLIWISLHVFYQGDLDALLAQGIGPLVEPMVAEGEISAYFFVRYWNGGPHVRLRLRPAGPSQAERVTTRAVAHLQQFLAANPGNPADGQPAYGRQAEFMNRFRGRLAGDWAPGQAYLEEAEPLQPVGTVQIRPYTFDGERYGGPRARPVSESHFCRSSELALAVLARTAPHPGVRSALALRMMAAAPAALGLTAAAAAELFGQYFGVADHFDPAGTIGFVERWGFVPFAQQEETVCQVLTGADTGSSRLAQVLLQAWQADLQECAGKLRLLWQQHQLTNEPPVIVLEYLHLLNNRLGISVPEELYLAYLLANGLQAIARR